jgi:hypothetical protein
VRRREIAKYISNIKNRRLFLPTWRKAWACLHLSVIRTVKKFQVYLHKKTPFKLLIHYPIILWQNKSAEEELSSLYQSQS